MGVKSGRERYALREICYSRGAGGKGSRIKRLLRAENSFSFFYYAAGADG